VVPAPLSKGGGLGAINSATNVPAIIATGANTKVNFQGN